jgi:hypothetical protein
MSALPAGIRLYGCGGALGVSVHNGIEKKMKSKLLKATVLATAAIAVGALASPVMARTLKYTFGTVSGGAYCEGLTLTQATVGHPTWGGTLTGCTNQDPAGGYDVKVNGGMNLDIATTDSLNNPSAGAFTFFLNLKQQYWYLYDTSGGVFAQINSGPLIRGVPSAKAPGAHRPATMPNPKGQLNQMF